MINVSIKPSLKSTTATGEAGSSQVVLSDMADFEIGDSVAIYGAGPSCTLPVPPAPTLVLEGSGSGTKYEYAAMAVDENFGYTPLGLVASISGPATLDSENEIIVEWFESDLDLEARHLAVYRRIDDGIWEIVGGLNANPIGFRFGVNNSENRPRVALWDDGLRELPTGRNSWWPNTAPSKSMRGMLRTYITSIDGNTATLKGSLEGSISNTYFGHDASLVLQEVIGSLSPRDNRKGGRIAVPAGIYQMHADLHINKEIVLEGEGRNNTVFRFEAGRGLIVERMGQWSVLRGFKVTTKARFLPNGSRIATGAWPIGAKINRTIGMRWFHGSGISLFAWCDLEQVSALKLYGNGITIFGDKGISNHANASHGSLHRCVSSANWGHGLFFKGSDANACNTFGCVAFTNHGWGLLDASFLGNHHIAPDTHGNRLGPFRTLAKTAGSTFLGAYQETGQGPSSVEAGSVVIGGTPGGGWIGQGLRILRSGDVRPEFHLRHDEQEPSVKTLFGHPRAEDEERLSQPELRRYTSSNEEDENDYVLNHFRRAVRDDSNALVQDYYVTTAYSSQEWMGPYIRGSGLIRFPRGIVIGQEPNARRILFAKPSRLPRGAYDVGDVILDATGATFVQSPTERFALGKTWTPDDTINVSDVRIPTIPNEFAYVASAVSLNGRVGRTGSDEPVWPEVVGQSIRDGTVLWECWGTDTPRLSSLSFS